MERTKNKLSNENSVLFNQFMYETISIYLIYNVIKV